MAEQLSTRRAVRPRQRRTHRHRVHAPTTAAAPARATPPPREIRSPRRVSYLVQSRATWAWPAPTSPATSSSTATCSRCSAPVARARRHLLLARPVAVPPLDRAAPLRPVAPPANEHRRPWRRGRHSQRRDAAAISHHYDVSNRFYRWVLGPSMAYTCAVFPDEEATLEEAQFEKFDLVCRKLGLRAGMRLLDVGCGWGGMVVHAAEHYGVEALGVTLSREQAEWGRARDRGGGLGDRAEVRFLDYRDVAETGFDAVSSIGLTEHVARTSCRPTSPSCTASCARRAGCSTTASPAPTTSTRSCCAAVHRPLRVPRRRAAGPRAPGLGAARRAASSCATRRTCASTTRAPWGLGREPRGPLGRGRRARSASRRRAPGACTWPARGSRSPRTTWSCTRCSA